MGCEGGRATDIEAREEPSAVRDIGGRVAVIGVCGSGVSAILGGRTGVPTPELERAKVILVGLTGLLGVAVPPVDGVSMGFT